MIIERLRADCFGFTHHTQGDGDISRLDDGRWLVAWIDEGDVTSSTGPFDTLSDALLYLTAAE